MARSRRFERLTPSLGGKCSIQLSYERAYVAFRLGYCITKRMRIKEKP